jgi:hypothetical protein
MSELDKQLIRDEALLEAADAVLKMRDELDEDTLSLVSAKIISLMTYP